MKIKYLYTAEGPIIRLSDIKELSTMPFDNVEEFEKILKTGSKPVGDSYLHAKTFNGQVYVIYLDDMKNKETIIGINTYSSLTEIIRTYIVNSWAKQVKKKKKKKKIKEKISKDDEFCS